jgi:hypothetical protein
VGVAVVAAGEAGEEPVGVEAWAVGEEPAEEEAADSVGAEVARAGAQAVGRASSVDPAAGVPALADRRAAERGVVPAGEGPERRRRRRAGPVEQRRRRRA